MQGTWEVQRLEQDGELAADAELLKFVIIRDDRFAFRYFFPRSKEYGDLVSRFKLDASQNPKEIDLTSDEDSSLHPGIYKLDGAMLTFCWSRKDPNNRPTDFTCPKGSERRFLVLRRVQSKPR
jgi:uncharacterized protein (TIGR03067 family)